MDIDIDHLAKLAKLKLSAEERSVLALQLPAIVAYVGQLQEVDTSGIDPSAYLTTATNVFRADEAQPSSAETRRALLDAFPERSGDLLKVPGVFE